MFSRGVVSLDFDPMKHTAAERFWAKVDTSAADGCWPWTAYRLPDDGGVRGNGYRRFGLIGSRGWRLVLAHRMALTFTHGDNPEGSAIAVQASVASTYTAAVGGRNLPTMARRSISVCLTPPRRPPPSRRWTSSRTASVRRERRPTGSAPTHWPSSC